MVPSDHSTHREAWPLPPLPPSHPPTKVFIINDYHTRGQWQWCVWQARGRGGGMPYTVFCSCQAQRLCSLTCSAERNERSYATWWKSHSQVPDSWLSAPDSEWALLFHQSCVLIWSGLSCAEGQCSGSQWCLGKISLSAPDTSNPIPSSGAELLTVMWTPETSLGCCPSDSVHLVCWDRVSHLSLHTLDRLGWLASEPQVYSCLCLPSAGNAIVHYYSQLSHGC